MTAGQRLFIKPEDVLPTDVLQTSPAQFPASSLLINAVTASFSFVLIDILSLQNNAACDMKIKTIFFD